MTVELCAAGPSEMPLIRAILDDYLHEIARHREVPVGAIDAASYPYLGAYWSEPGRHPFLIRSEGAVAGFALVRDPVSTGSAASQVAEFYIVPACRRCGIGRRAASALWHLFPGLWELEVQAQNVEALRFWSTCTAAEAHGRPVVTEIEAADGRRLRFNFQMGA